MMARSPWPQTGGAAVLARISGTPGVGNLFTAAVGPGFTITGYQWTRGGVDIAGATAATYTQVSGDSDANVACRVTGSYTTAAIHVPSGGAPPSQDYVDPTYLLEDYVA